jgi:type II secretory pathway component GspD/PulD (secretin)
MEPNGEVPPVQSMRIMATLLAAATLAVATLVRGSDSDTAAGRIELQFVDADVDTVAESVSNVTGRTIAIDSRVHHEITLISRKPLTPDEFYRAFVRAMNAAGLDVRERGSMTLVLQNNPQVSKAAF